MYHTHQKKISTLLLFLFIGVQTAQALESAGKALQIELRADSNLAQIYYNEPIFFLTGQIGELTPTLRQGVRTLLDEILTLNNNTIALFITAGQLWHTIVKKCKEDGEIQEDLSALIATTKEIQSTLSSENSYVAEQLTILAKFLEEVLCVEFNICNGATRSPRFSITKKSVPDQKKEKSPKKKNHQKTTSHKKNQQNLTRIVPGTDTAVNSAATLIGKVWDTTGTFFSGVGGNLAMVGVIAGLVGGALTWVTHTLRKPVEIDRKARNREGKRLRRQLESKYNQMFEEIETEVSEKMQEMKQKGKELYALGKQTEKIKAKEASLIAAQERFEAESKETHEALASWQNEHPSSEHTHEISSFLNPQTPAKEDDVWK